MGVGSHDDALAQVVDRVEGVQEHVLCGLLAGQEVDVVDYQASNPR